MLSTWKLKISSMGGHVSNTKVKTPLQHECVGTWETLLLDFDILVVFEFNFFNNLMTEIQIMLSESLDSILSTFFKTFLRHIP